MVDRLSPERRSRLMSRVRGKDTTPELVVRRLAHGLGYRFRLHKKTLPGKPDLVFPRLRVAIFVHGCFWHRHRGCPKATMPKSRVEYWAEKFERNVERDARVVRALEEAGWTVHTIWECETKDRDALRHRLSDLLSAATGRG